MVKRGKLGKEIEIKGKALKGSMSKGFNKVIKCSKKKKVIIGGVLISVLSLSLVGYFQSKSALASNYKSLKISEKTENLNTITPYNKITKGEEINVLLLGDESYLGDVVLNEDVTSFIESNYNSKVNLIDLSVNDASIYDQLNRYVDIEDREFDLVFLCFENSDEKEISKTNFSGIYESIIRDLKYNNASVDIVPIIKHNTVVNDTYYQIINGLSKYYDLELAKVNEDVVSNNTEGESIEDFRENYANVLTNMVENNTENLKGINIEYKEMYYGVTTLLEPYKVTIKGDKKKGFNVSQKQAKSSRENDYIRYKVEGNIIGLGYETSEKGGVIEIYVNRVLYGRIDTKSESEEVKYILISSNLTGENEIKLVNSNGGDITLLGIITSGNNTDSKEVENLNNILARNKGDYSGQQKDDSLYENAKIENNEVVTTEKEQSTPVKTYGNTGGNTQTKPKTNVQSKPNTSTQNSSGPSNNTESNTQDNEAVAENKPVENVGSNEIINNEGGGNINIGNNGGGNENINDNPGNINNGNTNNGSGNGGNVNNGINNSVNNSTSNVENNTTNNTGGSNTGNNTTNNVINNGSSNGNNNSNNLGGDSGNSNIGNGGSNSVNNNGGNSTNNAINNTPSNIPNDTTSNDVGAGNTQNSSNSSFQSPEITQSENIAPSE